MFGEKAFELIKELDRSSDNLPPYNDETVRRVLEEIKSLFVANVPDFEAETSGNGQFLPAIAIRHEGIKRNKRCLLAYLHHRLQRIRRLRWEFGSTLPAEIKINLSVPEYRYFTEYNKSLANYMASIGEGVGLNLTQDMTPPKSLYVLVKCLTDFGKFQIDTGEVVLLKKNSIHLLPVAQCESLIRQGVLEHIG